MTKLFATAVDSLSTAMVEGRYVRKRVPVDVLDLFAARLVLDHSEALLVEATTRSLATIRNWPESRGFEIELEPIEASSPRKTRLALRLLEPRYRDVFRALCEDVCDVISAHQDELSAIQAFYDRLCRWQSFLQKHGPDGLSQEAQCGLYGELLILRELVLPASDTLRALRAWRGCKKAPQDFQFDGVAIEVKSTRAAIPDKIAISNVRQLDSEGMRKMFLVVVHLNSNEVTGETLPELIDSLDCALREDARALLVLGLREVGYLVEHREKYVHTRYQVLGVHHFLVFGAFPCLTRATVPDGVKSVSYEISFDACREFAVDSDRLRAALRGSS